MKKLLIVLLPSALLIGCHAWFKPGLPRSPDKPATLEVGPMMTTSAFAEGYTSPDRSVASEISSRMLTAPYLQSFCGQPSGVASLEVYPAALLLQTGDRLYRDDRTGLSIIARDRNWQIVEDVPIILVLLTQSAHQFHGNSSLEFLIAQEPGEASLLIRPACDDSPASARVAIRIMDSQPVAMQLR